MGADNQHVETMKFLFDKRLALFNTRRDHEWKILFGVIGLIGAVDASLVVKSIQLPPFATGFWRIMLIILFISSVAYEFGVQARNRVDRIVMDDLYEMLCDEIRVPARSLVRIPVDRATEKDLGKKKSNLFDYTYMWAFICQTLVLLVLCLISWFIPDMIADTNVPQVTTIIPGAH